MLFQYCDGLIDLMHIFAVPIYQFGVWRSPVSAPGLGPGGRRFESCHPDTIAKSHRNCDDFFCLYILVIDIQSRSDLFMERLVITDFYIYVKH